MPCLGGPPNLDLLDCRSHEGNIFREMRDIMPGREPTRRTAAPLNMERAAQSAQLKSGMTWRRGTSKAKSLIRTFRE